MFATLQVTEEIQSIVKLLVPLTDSDPTAYPSSESNPLDTALTQLKNVARTLALNHTSQVNLHHPLQLFTISSTSNLN